MSAPTAETQSLTLPAQLEDFWAIAVEVWNSSFFGVSVGTGLAAIGVLLVGFAFRGLIAGWVIAFIRRLAQRTENRVDDKLVDALAGPMKLAPIIVAIYFAGEILGLGGENNRVVRSLIAVLIFWTLHNAVCPVAELMRPLQRTLTPVMIDWLTKALKALFIIVGAAAVLEIWGISVGPIIAGLGLLGVAVGLGAQDLFKNLIAGLLILTEKRFLPGDWVKVEGVVEGTVEKINFRSTLIRRFDKGPVHVPNAQLSDNAVINFSGMTHRRIYWIIGVRYDTTTEQLKQIRDQVLDYVMTEDAYAKPPEVSTFMRVDSFGPSSIDFMLYCFTKTTNWGEWLEIKEALALRIKEIVEEAGTDFAFPSTSVYLEGAELFQAPRDEA